MKDGKTEKGKLSGTLVKIILVALFFFMACWIVALEWTVKTNEATLEIQQNALNIAKETGQEWAILAMEYDAKLDAHLRLASDEKSDALEER